MRIGIVNDMPLAAEAMRRVLTLAPQHQLAWIAGDGEEAVDQCAQDKPDLVLMDLIMPRMDGVEATRRIMAETPCAILIVTADVDSNAARVFAAMGHGALDAVDTPLLDPAGRSAGAHPLLAKINAIGGLIGDRTSARRLAGVNAERQAPDRHLVAIGASAGGPGALAAVLDGLPPTFPAPIVIVQHVDVRFASGLADWLGQHSPLPVRLASEGDLLVPGQVLIAGTDNHLVFKTKDRLGYARGPLDDVYRPSIDVFFHSAARCWEGAVVGVLLTGMGSDGAQGLRALRLLGHHTIAQDQATSTVYGMPKAAAALAAAVDILPLGQIAPNLTRLCTAPARTRKGWRK